jgi:alkyl sulfatase BDS1-like metallo-beta-lactamase superfamily hydrolase
VTVENAVLHHHRYDEPLPDADATVRLTRDLLIGLGSGQAGLKDLVMSDDLQVEGSRLKLLAFLSLIERPNPAFPIVTP